MMMCCSDLKRAERLSRGRQRDEGEPQKTVTEYELYEIIKEVNVNKEFE
jgi:hypothetical protein